MSRKTAQRLAPHFFQVAYVVRDIDAAEGFLQQTLGIPRFTRMEDIHVAEGCAFRGVRADWHMTLSLGYLGDVQVELVQPIRGASPYAEFLEHRGQGLHHVAFLVPDFDATVAGLEGDGLEFLARGALGPGSHFAYFDCEGPGCSVIEILGFDEATRGFMEMLRERSAEAP